MERGDCAVQDHKKGKKHREKKERRDANKEEGDVNIIQSLELQKFMMQQKRKMWLNRPLSSSEEVHQDENCSKVLH